MLGQQCSGMGHNDIGLEGGVRTYHWIKVRVKSDHVLGLGLCFNKESLE